MLKTRADHILYGEQLQSVVEQKCFSKLLNSNHGAHLFTVTWKMMYRIHFDETLCLFAYCVCHVCSVVAILFPEN